MDTSNVEYDETSNAWLFVNEDGKDFDYKTEKAACKAQRKYRKLHGYDPLTGEFLFEQTKSVGC